MDITSLLAELASYLNIKGLSLDRYGVCKIAFDKKYSFCIEPDPEGAAVHLYSVLGPLTDTHQQIFYEEIFSRNLFGRCTGGCSLVCDTGRRELLLTQQYSLVFLTPGQIAQSIDHFIDQIERQTDWLLSFAQGEHAGFAAVTSIEKPGFMGLSNENILRV